MELKISFHKQKNEIKTFINGTNLILTSIVFFIFMYIAIEKNLIKNIPTIINVLYNVQIITPEKKLEIPSNLQDIEDTTPITTTTTKKWSFNFDIIKNHAEYLMKGKIYTLPTNIKDMLILHEGRKKSLYRDTAQKCSIPGTNKKRGYLTIGIGHMIGCEINSQNKLTKEMIGRSGWNGESLTDNEIDLLFDYDLQRITHELYMLLPWVENLNDARKAAMIDMAFNLGPVKLAKFQRSLFLIKNGRYKEASDNLAYTKWAEQVKGRAVRIRAIIERGTFR